MKKTFLITGVTGALGSSLAKRLLESSNVNIIGTKRKNSSMKLLGEYSAKIQFIDVDLQNWSQNLGNQKIDYIVHMATNYGRQNESYESIIATNLYFPMQVLQYALDHGVSYFINTDTLLPRQTSTYSLSKKQFLDWLKFTNDRVKVVNVMLENFYGPFEDQFVTKMIALFKENISSVDMTLGVQRRDFIHFEDVIDGYMTIFNNLEKFENDYYEFEMGTGVSYSIRDLMVMIKEITKNAHTKCNWGAINLRKNEVMDSKADIRHLNSLGWYPKHDLYAGLERLINHRT